MFTMKYIVNFDPYSLDKVVRALNEHKQYYFNNTTWNPNITHIAKWNYPGDPPVEFTFRQSDNKNGSIVDVHYHLSNSMLLNINASNNVVSDFDFRFQFINKENKDDPNAFEVLRLPKDKYAAKWLSERNNTPAGTNKNLLVAMFLATRAATEFFPFAMDKKETGESVIFTVPVGFTHKVHEGISKEKQDRLITKEKALDHWWENRAEHLCDNWDTVTLTEEQLTKIQSYIRDLDMHLNLKNIVLDKFAFRLIHKIGFADIYYYDKISDTEMSIMIDSEDPEFAKRISYRVRCSEAFDSVKNEPYLNVKLIEDSISKEDKEWIVEKSANDNFYGWPLFSFFVINTFLLHYKDVSMDIQERICKPSTDDYNNRASSNKSDRSRVNLFKSYTLKKDWVVSTERRKQEYHCLAWGVRGHERHLRDGRTIFVNPYIKGKERSKYKCKDYILIPNNISAS